MDHVSMTNLYLSLHLACGKSKTALARRSRKGFLGESIDVNIFHREVTDGKRQVSDGIPPPPHETLAC